MRHEKEEMMKAIGFGVSLLELYPNRQIPWFCLAATRLRCRAFYFPMFLQNSLFQTQGGKCWLENLQWKMKMKMMKTMMCISSLPRGQRTGSRDGWTG